jgi:hypothetical protein
LRLAEGAVETTKTQIIHYRNRTGLILAIHLTHHAGTALGFSWCHVARQRELIGAAPFASRVDKQRILDRVADPDYPIMDPKAHLDFVPDKDISLTSTDPWRLEDTTARSIAAIREHFHFVAWE